MFRYIPLLVGVGLFGLLLLSQLYDRAEIVLDGIGQALLGETVSSNDRRREQLPKMEAAHIPRSHRSFSSQTVLYSILAAVAAGLISLTVLWVTLSFVSSLADSVEPVGRLAALGVFELLPRLLITLFGSLAATVIVGLTANWLRWFVIDQQAYARGSQIDATLPRTVAFMYALSRSGMAFTQVLRTLADNRAVYGEAADEVNATVRQMDLFGVDLQTAINDMGERTPSDNMAELSENLGSVLGSGRSLSTYLRSQYERYKEEAEAQQEQYLELLATLAEAYVTVLVAGPLFIITTLAVIGLVLQDTLPVMRIITYVGIPLATLAFIVYVDSVTQSTGTPGETEHDDIETMASGQQGQTATDGGTIQDRWLRQREALDTYDSLNRVLTWVTQPGEIILGRPPLTFLITVPIGLLWVAFTIGEFDIELFSFLETVVPPVTEAGIFILGTYAVVYDLRKRQARSIEKAIPDFLERFASVNDAGMTIIESFRRVKDSDLGGLTPELERTWRDIQWGSDVETALKRMDRRIDSPVVTRAVTLSTNAMQTSDDIAPVLEIAADEARSTHVLNRQRKQTMLTYLVVIYIAFFVFLGIMAALMISFIPAIEDVMAQMAESTSGSGGAAPRGGLGLAGSAGDVNISGYETIFFHVTLVQATCSGLVAGQLGQGSIKDGVKHSTAMLVITYIMFTFI
ncbi:flagellar protein FlaJ [Halohasta litchfieldiae]|jgi:flagellar protein FlaJ|uniref:Flagellar protein FlaJ n=1 Tax=Halohasta litchfieldiae TaxID=1073996 RepID=A0A1H6T8L8_9EURY|nr:type II secretion system F family protein [Halohasta litchfieldiae]ATW87659.1 flagellar protein FlaJ [Halohasta litchfieldiae]SEI76443.1 flagellar protein FlaJ [Halohasta litchfieldiae]